LTYHALKTVNKSSLHNQTLENLLHQELYILSTINHPNIMHVTEILEDRENYYIVTEILEGGELFDRIIEV